MEKFHLYAIVAGVLLVGSFVLPAATETYSELQKDDSAKLPALTAIQEQQLLNLVLSDKLVQEKLEGRNYDFVGVGFFTENINVDQPIWKPIVHLNVEKVKSLGVLLDAKSQNIEKIDEIPYVKLTDEVVTFASNYYTGGSTGVNGLRFTASAPTYSTTDGTTNSGTSFLLNAVAANADMNFLCDPGHYPNTYWAQTGFTWVTVVEAVTWTDTAAGCAAQSTGLSYTEGNNYEFKIYVSGTTWNIFAKNLSSGASFTKQRTNVTWLTMKTSEFNTGVFFENQNTGTSWYTKYSSTSLSGSGAKFSTNGGSTWSNWQSGAKQVQKCDHTRQTSTVISNNLSSGGTASWNLQTMSGIHC